MKKSGKRFKRPQAGVFYLYKILCANGWEYVGVTKYPKPRIKAHFKGRGAEFTKKHRPVKLKEVWCLGQMTYEEAESWEDRYTLECMGKNARTRGGHYLSDREKAQDILKCHPVYENVMERMGLMDESGFVPDYSKRLKKEWGGSKKKPKGKRDKDKFFCFIPRKEITYMRSLAVNESADYLYGLFPFGFFLEPPHSFFNLLE